MRKSLIAICASTVLFGLGLAPSFEAADSFPMGLLADSSTSSISKICGFTRIAGENSKTFIAISAKETVGTYGALYDGTVYDPNGNPLPLSLKANGAATGSWIGEGTRRFEFKTDASSFVDAIGTGTTFYITKGSVFEGADTSIVFEKNYEFSNIYSGLFSITESEATDVSFSIKEVETRLSGTEFRVGVSDMQGISAGFPDVFKGVAEDMLGNPVNISISDYKNGSTSAGNRRVLLTLDHPVSDNCFLLRQSSTFENAMGTKTLHIPATYQIKHTTLQYCDGNDHHIYGEPVTTESAIVSTCIVCGHSESTPIHLVSIGSSDKYCQTTFTETQAEVSIKIGGCSGYDTSSVSSVYRGKCLLGDQETALKIMVSGDIVRLYLYLARDNQYVENGMITISPDEMFKADGSTLNYLKFANGFKITYHTETHKYRADTIEHEWVSSKVSDVTKKNWVSKAEEEVIVSYIDVNMSNGVYVPDSSPLVYRGKGKVDGETKDVRISLQKVDGKDKLAFIFNGDAKGLLEVLSSSIFYLDSDGTYFSHSDLKYADDLSFESDISLNYDCDNNLVNPIACRLSFTGVGAWSQPIDTPQYNVMCSFSDCSFYGISKDESEIHPETLKRRGYHFYGKGYNKDSGEELPVDIWVSSFENGDDALKMATVKTAVYCDVASSGSRGAIKMHQGDVFVCAAYNMTLQLDSDYLIKWYVNSSRTTAGHYNDDNVGPTIMVDVDNIPTYVEGDEKPTLPVAVEDDVDDIVQTRAQIWQEGALDENGKLNIGVWTVTLTAKDAAGNEANPVYVKITVNPKKRPEPEPVEPTNDNRGLVIGLSVGGGVVLIGGACLAVLLIRKKKRVM